MPESFRLIAPPHTGFHPDGSLNLDVIDAQAELLVRSGVDGVFVAGTTGEGASLSNRERMALAERWVSVARSSNLEVIVQVGHTAACEASELAAHAQRIGASAVAAHAPPYFKPANCEQLGDFLRPIARAAADLPFYYYDIPVFTGVTLPTATLLEQARASMPNLVGVKFSNPDLAELQRCLAAAGGSLEVLFGCDEVLLAAVALGVHGAVGTTYNFAAPIYRRMLAALREGDWAQAQAEQRSALSIVSVLQRFGFAAASKAVLRLWGIDLGPVRAPLARLDEEQWELLCSELDQIGLVALCSPDASSVPAAVPAPHDGGWTSNAVDARSAAAPRKAK